MDGCVKWRRRCQRERGGTGAAAMCRARARARARAGQASVLQAAERTRRCAVATQIEVGSARLNLSHGVRACASLCRRHCHPLPRRAACRVSLRLCDLQEKDGLGMLAIFPKFADAPRRVCGWMRVRRLAIQEAKQAKRQVQQTRWPNAMALGRGSRWLALGRARALVARSSRLKHATRAG